MTIASQTSRVSYVGNGSTTAFSVPFYFSANADIVVMLQSSTGTQTTQTLGTDYTLTGAGVSSGGTVTFTTAPTATTGAVIAIYRDPPVTQTASYNNNDPFPAKSHENALDKLTALAQRSRDIVTRSLQLRDSDATVDMHLPALRQNKLLGFDGSNNPVAVLGPSFVGGTDVGSAIVNTRAVAAVTTFAAAVQFVVTGGYATAGDGGGARYKRGTGAGSFTDGGAVSWVPVFDDNILNSRVFGVLGDGVTDDTTALQAAVTAASGKTLLIKGLCGVTSAILVPANTTIIGRDNKLDGFKVLGSSVMGGGILHVNDVSDVSIRCLSFIGNLVEPTPFSTGAIFFDLDLSSTGDMVGLEVSRCYFANFRTTQWIWLAAAAQLTNTNQMREIKIFGNEVYAVIGCATTNAISSTQGNTFVRVTGNTLIASGTGSLQGSIANILFENNSCLGFGLSGMLMCFQNVRDVVVTGNVTRSMGNNTLAADTAYTYLFYNSTAGEISPTNIVVSGNSGYGNHNNAIYCAGAVNTVIVGNHFSFTSESGIEPTLPHGANISLNAVVDCTVVGNTLTDGLGGVAYIDITDAANSNVTIANNTIRSSTNSSGTQVAYGILLSGTTTGSAGCVTNVTGNTITLTGTTATGISIVGSSTLDLGRLNIANNIVNATQFGINTPATLKATTTLYLSGNRYTGALALYGINLDSAGVVNLTDEVVDAISVVSGSAVGIRLAGTHYRINGLTVSKQTAGTAAFSAVGVQGSMKNVRFPDCTVVTLVVASSIGLARPAWTGTAFDVVQNLASTFYTETGVTPKYTLDSYVWATATTWLDRRMPTGA